MLFRIDFKNFIIDELRQGVLTYGDSAQNGSSEMQPLLFNPGTTGSDELEPKPLASIKCRDLGLDCSFEAKGATEREIIRHLIEHIEYEHDLPVLTADTLFRIKKGIKKY